MVGALDPNYPFSLIPLFPLPGDVFQGRLCSSLLSPASSSVDLSHWQPVQ